VCGDKNNCCATFSFIDAFFERLAAVAEAIIISHFSSKAANKE
jgi:hypothetical protein